MDEEILDSAKKLPEERAIANKINTHLCGTLTHMSKGKAEVEFLTQEDMQVDSKITHTGFIYSAASFCALCAIDKKNSIIIGADTKFLAPVEINQKITFRAKSIQEDIRKCEVQVEGFILDIKVFDGMFYIVILDKSFFRIKFKDENKD